MDVLIHQRIVRDHEHSDVLLFHQLIEEPQRRREMTLVIEARDLWRVYPSKMNPNGIPALRGVNLDVQPGTFVALKGRSGSGKTTLLNCLAGLDRPSSGSVNVLGHDLMQMSDQVLTEWRREQIGLVFQSFGLLPTLSAYEKHRTASAHQRR